MTDTVETPVENSQPTVTLVDLQNALRIIDAAAERGAFKGAELSAVGGVRDKIATFLEAVLPQATEGEQAPAEAPVAEEAPAPAKKAPAKKKAK